MFNSCCSEVTGVFKDMQTHKNRDGMNKGEKKRRGMRKKRKVRKTIVILPTLRVLLSEGSTMAHALGRLWTNPSEWGVWILKKERKKKTGVLQSSVLFSVRCSAASKSCRMCLNRTLFSIQCWLKHSFFIMQHFKKMNNIKGSFIILVFSIQGFNGEHSVTSCY